jgi:very-short-patch-repair endonuclease
MRDVSALQCGAITRRQALASGVTHAGIRARLLSGRWQRIYSRVYATFSGPVPRECLLWAVLLRAGDGALLSHETAAELVGLADTVSNPIHVTVPGRRRIAPIPDVVLHYRQKAADLGHPSRTPPQARIEETVVDLTQSTRTVDQALGWIARACGRRLTTPHRIMVALEARKKLRWRAELIAAVCDVSSGCHSVLELRYLRVVERAHRLPSGHRQYPVHGPAGRRYDDVRYEPYGVVVELDGRAAHATEDRWRDTRRDNASVALGDRVLRYGWADVVGRPCLVAAQVAIVLAAAGWRGSARRCSAECVIR